MSFRCIPRWSIFHYCWYFVPILLLLCILPPNLQVRPSCLWCSISRQVLFKKLDIQEAACSPQSRADTLQYKTPCTFHTHKTVVWCSLLQKRLDIIRITPLAQNTFTHIVQTHILLWDVTSFRNNKRAKLINYLYVVISKLNWKFVPQEKLSKILYHVQFRADM